MAELSKFYQVTNQIMLEYVANQYDANDTPDEKTTDYTVYIGKDGNVYYTENHRIQIMTDILMLSILLSFQMNQCQNIHLLD